MIFINHVFFSQTIEALRKLSSEPDYYFIGVGLKLPHLAVHIPFKYYDMYRDKQDAFKLSKKELRFPPTTTGASFRCCAEDSFRYMNHEGIMPATRSVNFPHRTDFVFPR